MPTPWKYTKEDLREYQVRTIRFMLKRRFTALFLDMGLGKTISALTAIVHLLKTGEIENVLLVAPIRVIYGVWRQEAKLWKHTRNLKFSIVHGTPNERMAALRKPAHIYLINPDGLKWLSQLAGRKPWPFDMLVVDESSMFKKPNTARFRAVRKGLRYFKRRTIMTGTPTPNSLLELWPQMYMVDRGHHLGTRYAEFRDQHFVRSGYMGYQWEPTAHAQRSITRAISSVTISLRSEDWITLPPLIDVPVWIDLPTHARTLYERMEQDLFLEFEEGYVESETAAAVHNRLSQIASGALWLKDENEQKVWRPIHDAKMDALDEIIEELQGEPPIVSYRFGHDRERIKARYKGYTVMGKGTSGKATEVIERQWNNRKLPGLLVHPQSAGHGLNLQRGGRHFIWYSPTFSLEQYQQLIKRLHRSGQTGTVFNYLILARGTTDEAAIEAIEHKDQGQQAVKDALWNYYQRKTRGLSQYE